MVLVTSVVPTPDEWIVVGEEEANQPDLQLVPAWWTQASEKQYINIMKEYAAGVHKGNYQSVNYTTISQKIVAMTDPFKKNVPIMTPHLCPDKKKTLVGSIKQCAGYEHCDGEPKMIEGFFFPNHLKVTNDEIFTNWDDLIDQLNLSLGLVEASQLQGPAPAVPSPMSPAVPSPMSPAVPSPLSPPSPHTGPEGCWMSPSDEDDEPDSGHGWCAGGSMDDLPNAIEDVVHIHGTPHARSTTDTGSILEALGELNPFRGVLPYRTRQTSTSASSTDVVYIDV